LRLTLGATKKVVDALVFYGDVCLATIDTFAAYGIFE